MNFTIPGSPWVALHLRGTQELNDPDRTPARVRVFNDGEGVTALLRLSLEKM
jgi:hypothetical protein